MLVARLLSLCAYMMQQGCAGSNASRVRLPANMLPKLRAQRHLLCAAGVSMNPFMMGDGDQMTGEVVATAACRPELAVVKEWRVRALRACIA